MTVSAGRLVLAWLLTVGSALAAGHQGGVLHLGAYQPAGTIDPMINYESDFWQLFYITQDGLLTFRKAEGAAGLVVVPDLAEALPAGSDDGRTYLFRLRRGVRFSDGREVGVGDVVASFRRMFRVSGPNTGSWYNIIVGADACIRAPAGCMLAGGIEGDAAARTVTIHLTKPDAEFSQKIALPFASILPADTPGRDLGTTPPVATGPYMIASFDALRMAWCWCATPTSMNGSAMRRSRTGYRRPDRAALRAARRESEVSADRERRRWTGWPIRRRWIGWRRSAVQHAWTGPYPSDAGLLLS